jgi:hypothetical protein
MTEDVEHIRSTLRGRRLDVLAAQLCAPIPVLEQFVHGSARLTPALMAGLARLTGDAIGAADQEHTHAYAEEARHENWPHAP